MQVFPYMQGEFVSSFYGKSDMMDCLIASCNIPFYLTKWPTVTCRGRQCVDGFFATKHKAFGCPESGALRDIKVRQRGDRQRHLFRSGALTEVGSSCLPVLYWS